MPLQHCTSSYTRFLIFSRLCQHLLFSILLILNIMDVKVISPYGFNLHLPNDW